MAKRMFLPKELLFSLTTRCNLRCAHCDIEQDRTVLNKKEALEFVAACAHHGIDRVGFTGGEPFLELGLMCAISKEAVKRGMLFGRVMTNAGWFRTERELRLALDRLVRAGYDGDFCMSVDAFHRQSLKKCASFVNAAAAAWSRPDIVSIAAVKGAKDGQTRARLARLARILRGRLIIVNRTPSAIKSKNLFIKIFYIDLSAVGIAAALKNPWGGKWFKDDMCKGPGNVFFVLPDGKVKPCCGYAADADILTIGSIKRDSPKQLLCNARKNRFVSSVFSSGLHPIRKRLDPAGVILPGKTTDHCLLCHYLTALHPIRMQSGG